MTGNGGCHDKRRGKAEEEEKDFLDAVEHMYAAVGVSLGVVGLDAPETAWAAAVENVKMCDGLLVGG